MGPTAELARFAADLQLDDLPADVVEQTRRSVLDALGCAVFGSRLETSQKLNAVLRRMGGTPEARILGTGTKTSAYFASLANGTQIHALELDDVGAYNHPAASIIPAMTAAAERRGGVSGADVIAAVAAAYEISTRIAESTGLAPESEIGWHTPGFHGSFGGVVAAGRVLRLNGETMANAMGLAGDLAGGGLMSARTTAAASKKMHSGRAAATGVLGALLALEGMRGIDGVLEQEPWGYLWALSGYRGTGERRWDIAVLTEGLGDRWLFPTRVTLKSFPAIGMGQTVFDNVRKLRRREHFEADQIERVTVGMTRFHWQSRVRRPIDDVVSATFSPSYAAALALLHDIPPVAESPAGLERWLSNVNDPLLRRLLERVDEIVDEDLDQTSPYSVDTTIEVTLSNGSTVRESSAYERSLASPGAKQLMSFTDDDVRNKFRNLTRDVIGASATELAVGLVDRLEHLGDVNELFEVVAGGDAS